MTNTIDSDDLAEKRRYRLHVARAIFDLTDAGDRLDGVPIEAVAAHLGLGEAELMPMLYRFVRDGIAESGSGTNQVRLTPHGIRSVELAIDGANTVHQVGWNPLQPAPAQPQPAAPLTREAPSSRYRFIRQVKAGGEGTVWEGLDSTLERRIAIKVLHLDMPSRPSMRHRALEQARFEHANVIRVYDLVPVQHPESGEVVDGLVMEFVDGLKLGERLRLEMDTVTARALGIGLIDGIAAIHAERAHGDLHDGQVLVRGTEAKIIDLAALTSVGTSHLRRLDDMRAEDLVRLCGFLSDLLFYGAGPDVSSEFRRDVRERSKTPSLKDLRAAFEAATGAPPADPAFAVAVGQARDQLAKKLDTDALATGLRSAVPAQRSAAIDRVAMMAQTRRQVPRQLIELLERGVIDRARPERERTRAIEVLRELRAGQSIRPDMVAEWFSPGTSVALVDAFSTLFRDEPEAVTLLCEALEKADVPKEPDYALIGAIHRALTTIHAVLGQHALDLSVELCRRCLDVARRFVSCEKLAPEVKLIESEVEG